jgi:hypothetical protein
VSATTRAALAAAAALIARSQSGGIRIVVAAQPDDAPGAAIAAHILDDAGSILDRTDHDLVDQPDVTTTVTTEVLPWLARHGVTADPDVARRDLWVWRIQRDAWTQGGTR